MCSSKEEDLKWDAEDRRCMDILFYKRKFILYRWEWQILLFWQTFGGRRKMPGYWDALFFLCYFVLFSPPLSRHLSWQKSCWGQTDAGERGRLFTKPYDVQPCSIRKKLICGMKDASRWSGILRVSLPVAFGGLLQLFAALTAHAQGTSLNFKPSKALRGKTLPKHNT